jgi:hypothetical protein
MKEINYPKDFVERTKKLINTHYDCIKKTSKLEVTFLINCLLGLIVAVAENGKGKGLIKEKNFLGSIEKIGFLKKDTTKQNLISSDETTIKVAHKESLGEYKYEWFLTKIRNAIAHQHIEPINKDEKWTGVKMWNEPTDGIKDFEIELTNTELKELALKIAEEYLSQK